MTFNLNNLNMFFALLAKIVIIYISVSKKKKIKFYKACSKPHF